jgi:hypothetical protein
VWSIALKYWCNSPSYGGWLRVTANNFLSWKNMKEIIHDRVWNVACNLDSCSHLLYFSAAVEVPQKEKGAVKEWPKNGQKEWAWARTAFTCIPIRDVLQCFYISYETYITSSGHNVKRRPWYCDNCRPWHSSCDVTLWHRGTGGYVSSRNTTQVINYLTFLFLSMLEIRHERAIKSM